MPYFYKDPHAPAPNRPDSLGVVALIERDGAFLLDRRVDDGRWGLIGGVVESNESLADALRREVWEETGLTLRVYQLFGTFSDPSRIIQYPDGSIMRIVTLVYRVEVEDFSALRCSAESTEMRFFSREELVAIDVVETHRHIVDRLLLLAPGVSIVLE